MKHKGHYALILALLLVLMLVLAFSSAAMADVSSIEVMLTPEKLAEPGQATVDIIIQNTSDIITMEDATLEGPQINPYSIGDIAPLGTRYLQIPGVRVSAELLGTEFNYRLSWTESGVREEKRIPVLIRREWINSERITRLVWNMLSAQSDEIMPERISKIAPMLLILYILDSFQ